MVDRTDGPSTGGLFSFPSGTVVTRERFEGLKPSKTYTCSIVISLRTVSKSIPGTVVPDSPTAWLVFKQRSVPFRLHRRNGNDPSDLIGRLVHLVIRFDLDVIPRLGRPDQSRSRKCAVTELRSVKVISRPPGEDQVSSDERRAIVTGRR